MYLSALDLKSCVFCVNNAVPGVAPFGNHPTGVPETHIIVFLEHTRLHFCHQGVDFFFFN